MRLAPQSLRAKLALLSAVIGSVAIVAGATGTYVIGKQALLDTLDRSLATRSAKVLESLKQTGDFPNDEPFAAVFTIDGQSDAQTPAFKNAVPLLTPEELRFAFERQFILDRDVVEFGRARILAVPAQIQGTKLVIIVVTSRQEFEDNLVRLRVGLGVAAPLLSLATGLGVWLVVGATLRPVRRMTDEAAVISGANLDRRLAVPPGGDELTHLGTTLNGMLGRIEDSFRRERSFVDDASHELRTPLAIMRGEIELALTDASTTETVILESLREEVERLAALADDLLVLARVDSHRAAVGCTDLPEAVDKIIGRLRPATKHPVIVDVQGRPSAARVSTGALDRIVTNLVANADRYATKHITVVISEEQDDDSDWVVLSVSDDGPGFPIPFLGRAFERFAVPDPARGRSKSGTGLGLSIVDELAKAVGGSATASNVVADKSAEKSTDKSTDRTGAVVTVRFPVVKDRSLVHHPLLMSPEPVELKPAQTLNETVPVNSASRSN
jgi:two-component system, OmpR family, sensor kinase